MVNSKHASGSAAASHKSNNGAAGAAHQRHSQVLPDLNEHQLGKFLNVIYICLNLTLLSFSFLEQRAT